MDELTKPVIQGLVEHFDAHPPGSFDGFLDHIPEHLAPPVVDGAVKKYRTDKDNMDDERWNVIFRLLGIYARCRYREEMIGDLKGLVDIDTSAGERPQHENPAIIETGNKIADLARRFGLEFTNYENYMYQVDLAANRPGADSSKFGLLTHCDVVPVNRGDWKSDPFDMQSMQLDQLFPGEAPVPILYGRGTEDDKCSIISALYAMRVVRENEIPVGRRIRLLVETTEESSGAGIEYLKSNHEDRVPEYNVVLDADYPVVSAESGDAAFSALFPLEEVAGSGPRIVGLTGASAPNQIPESARFSVQFPESTNTGTAKEGVDSRAADFVRAHAASDRSGVPGITSRWQSQDRESPVLDVTVTGISAHSSQPASGLNPVPLALLFMDSLVRDAGFPLEQNHFTRAARYVADLFGTGYLGERFGVAYSDNAGTDHPPDMGPLFMSLTQAGDRLEWPKDSGKESIRLVCDVRNPRGNLPVREPPDSKAAAKKSAQKLVRDIERRLQEYDPEVGIVWDPEDPVSTMTWLWVDSRAGWMETLLNVFNQVFIQPGEPAVPAHATPGSTTAKELPKAVSFGPALGAIAEPPQKYMGHNANEYKRLENFYLDLQLVTEAMLRIANTPRLD